ncbi:MAG: ABC transporter ATP-binding protein [Elusimicrobia bacterium]|nr:ABC transporter ATP-binding protein [Elusimicrobiota bacterium]
MLIELKGVTKVYAGKGASVTALHGIDLAVEKGEFTALAGPSGSGKSTLLNIIGTLDTASSGSVAYDGRSVSGLSENELADFRLRSLGFVFQAYNLIPVLTACENVEYVLALQGVEKGERRQRARQALSQVGLDAEMDRRPDLLSGGQQQRVAVARSIVHRPMVVLADEPTANLDSKTAEALLELMVGLNKDHGVTFLFSSHDPRVLSLARRVVHMVDGRLA